MKSIISLVILIFVAPAFSGELNQKRIEELTGLKGSYNEKEHVFKVSYARDDLKVSVRGTKVTPALGLTAWAAFMSIGNQVTVMGDIVLTEDQVNQVMSTALDSGLEVTALHNHFFYDSPKVMFMHIGGTGSEDHMASAVGNVFKTLKETAAGKVSFPSVDIDPANSKITTEKLDAVLNSKGDLKNGVYKYVFAKKTKMAGHEMGAAMGVNTWAAFAGTDEQAVVDGDFAMYEKELQGVLKSLRKSNVNVIAIHNHMTQEEPRIVFLHYWGIGRAVDLAKAVKLALDTQK